MALYFYRVIVFKQHTRKYYPFLGFIQKYLAETTENAMATVLCMTKLREQIVGLYENVN